MATQLGLYNSALRFLGEVRLLALSDDRDIRYSLDDVWADGLINAVLEQGYWYFAMRASQINSDPTLKPPYGLSKGFEQPSDWLRTAAICSDPYYNSPITSFTDESGFWFCDTDPIYVRYVSNDTRFGGNLGAWPQSFAEFVGAHMAWKVAPKTTGSRDKTDEMEKLRHRLLTEARSKAAMNESAVFPPLGAWVRARFGRNAGGFDRGSRNTLIG
jgi:uncharacterized protein YneR